MGEGIEALFAVVAAHAGIAHAAEGHVRGGEVDDGIVDAAAAEGATVQQFSLRFPIGRKDVEGQRAGAGAHEGNDLIERFIRQHRQDGAEDLLLHDGGIRGDIGKQRRLDEAARVVMAAAEGDGLVFQQAEKAAVVLFGDDGGHVRIVAGGEKLLEGGAERLDKGLLDGLVDEEIVRLHTGLAGVQYLAKGDAAGGEIQRLDVGSFNGRYFSYTASCGAFTRTSYSTPQSLKNTLGHLAYILEGIKDLPSIRPYHLRVETESSVLEDDFIFCAITNSTSVGGILKLDKELVSLNDGLFEVMLIRSPEVAIQLTSIIHGITAMDLPNEMVHFFEAGQIRVTSDEDIEWTLDGERAEGGSVAEMRNLHSAIQIVLPEHASEGEMEL